MSDSDTRHINRYLYDRYLEIEAVVKDKGATASERAQMLRAKYAADLLHSGPTDRATILRVTKQICEFFARVKKANHS